MVVDAVNNVVRTLYCLYSVDGSERHAADAMQIYALTCEIEVLDFCEDGELSKSQIVAILTEPINGTVFHVKVVAYG